MATAAATVAPRRSTAPVRAPEVDRRERPDLRVVEPVDDSRGSRSLAGLIGTFTVLLLFVCIFGVVIFQVLLVQAQSQLDDLDGARAQQESRAQALDLEIADLESPERVVAAAHGLGMISPDEPVYLEPAEGDDARATLDRANEPVGTVATTVPAPGATASGTGGTSGTTGVTTTGTTLPTTGVTVPSGPPYTAENNWGAGGPPTTPPVYNEDNNWGAGPNGASGR